MKMVLQNVPRNKTNLFYFILTSLVSLSFLILMQAASFAMNIQEITSPGGIKAWLVEEKRVPLITMEFAFSGGSSQDEKGKEGVAYFVSGMMDEGAGDLTASEFQAKKEELAFRMNFDALRDNFAGSFQTLKENQEQSFDMLRLALTKPRFDQKAFDRVKSQILTGLKFDANDPNSVAAKNWRKIAFGSHVYGRDAKGTEKTLKSLSPDDLRNYTKKVLAKDNLRVAVVGDIDAESLGILLDRVFGDLPEKSELVKIPYINGIAKSQKKVIEMNVPQSVVQFGHEGILRKDPDFVAAYVLNYIIGGGGFSSRLTEEVREKRGLAYSVYSYLSPLRHGAVYLGGVATENKSVNKSIEVIKKVFSDVAENGPTEKEVENAKRYLTGSYALRFDTSPKIASQLLWIQVEGLGIDYIKKRNSLIEAVSLEDLKRVAKRLLKPEDLLITIVGKPGSGDGKG